MTIPVLRSGRDERRVEEAAERVRAGVPTGFAAAWTNAAGSSPFGSVTATGDSCLGGIRFGRCFVLTGRLLAFLGTG
jgi:hypothetical protein